MTDILSITQTFPTIDFVVVGGDTLSLQLPSPAVFVLPEFVANESGVFDVVAASEVSAPVVGQIHIVLADSVSSASIVGAPAPGQSHVLTADDIASTSNVTTPTAADVAPGDTALTAEDLTSVSSVDTPVVGQAHAFTADNISSTSNVGAPVIGQSHTLTADDVSSTSNVTTPTAADVGGTEDTLTADDVSSASEVSTPAPGQVHALTADGVSSVSNVDTPTAAAATGSDLQTLANDIFVGGRTGILIAPGEADYQETGSQTTASAADDLVGSIVSLDPTGGIVVATSDSARPVLKTAGGVDYYEISNTPSELILLDGTPSGRYTIAFALRIEDTETNFVLIHGDNAGHFSFIGQDGSGSTSLNSGLTSPQPTYSIDSLSSTTRDQIHTNTAVGDWVYVLIEDFDPGAWTEVKFSGYGGIFNFDGDLGPMLIVDDDLTTQELIDVETAIMAAVTP